MGSDSKPGGGETGAEAGLHLLGVSEDGTGLRLADDSREYVLPIDDRLRAAVNGHLSRLGQLTMALESHISPREIQARIRSGESAEQVAASAGVPVERVLRFVGPVLREREHAAEIARAARVERDTAGPAPLLGDVVDLAMARRGLAADDAAWDAAKADDGTWTITISWPAGSHRAPSGSSSWRFDVVRRQVAARDAGARELAGLREPGATQLPDADPFDDESDADRTDGGRVDGGRVGQVTPFTPRLAPAPAEQAPVEHAPVERAPVEQDAQAEAETAAVEDEGSANDGQPAAEDAPPPRRGRGGRRAQVPKWDDIVFGIKPPTS